MILTKNIGWNVFIVIDFVYAVITTEKKSDRLNLEIFIAPDDFERHKLYRACFPRGSFSAKKFSAIYTHTRARAHAGSPSRGGLLKSLGKKYAFRTLSPSRGVAREQLHCTTARDDEEE